MGLKTIKILLFLVNAVFLICSISLLSIGAWTVADKIFMSDIIGSDLYAAASYMLIISGLVIFIIAIIGCIGTQREKKCFVLSYFIILLITFIFLIIAAIMAVVLRGELEEIMSNAMAETLQNQYGYRIDTHEENRVITESWDKTQKQLQCCGIKNKGWNLYVGTKWYRDQPEHEKKYVPKSCCVWLEELNRYKKLKQCQNWQFGPPNINEGAKNDALYYEGCYDVGLKLVMEQANILVAIGFAFSMLLISGLVLSLCMYCILQRRPDEERCSKPI